MDDKFIKRRTEYVKKAENGSGSKTSSDHESEGKDAVLEVFGDMRKRASFLNLGALSNKRGSIFGVQVEDSEAPKEDELKPSIVDAGLLNQNHPREDNGTDSQSGGFMNFMNNFKKLNFDNVLTGLDKKAQSPSKRDKSSDEEDMEGYQKGKKYDDKKRLAESIDSFSDYSNHNSIYELNDGGEVFKQGLSEEQKLKLMQLQDEVFQKSVFDERYKPSKDILESKFYLSLSDEQVKQFIRVNQRLF